MLSKYLSVTDVQRELGLSAAQVQYLIDSRRLPAFRVFGKWRIERELLERMVDNLYEEEPRADIGGGSQAGQPTTAESATDPPCLTAGMLETAARIAVLPRRPLDGALGLTGQQQKVLELVGQGLSNAEIAANLTVEISTVKSHVSRILQRCALRDREQLIVLAWQSGLMSGSSPGTATT